MRSGRWPFLGSILLISLGIFFFGPRLQKETIVPRSEEISESVSSEEREREERSLEEEEEQELGLILLGTVLNRRPASGTTGPHAFIESLRTRSVGDYQLNDEVEGWTIVEISLGSVVLLKEGRKVALTVGWPKEEDTVIEISPTERVVHRDALVEKVENLQQLWQEVAVIPHLEKGQIKGFQIASVDAKDLLNQMGFRKGDIIQAVNGQTLSSFQEAGRIAQEVRKELEQNPIVNVRILRDKKLQTFTYTLH